MPYLYRTTTAYHPQTNGFTERFNGTLGDMLSVYVSSDHDDWDLVLPDVTYSYNTAIQTTTGFSPLYLAYRREPSCILGTVLPYRPDVPSATQHQMPPNTRKSADNSREPSQLKTSGGKNLATTTKLYPQLIRHG